MCGWRPAPPLILVCFHGIGSYQPKSSDFFSSCNEVERRFVFVWYLQGRIIGESDRISH
jgi:hypothetical protein